VLVVEQIPVWRTSLSLWQHTVDVSPLSPFARNNLGEALVKEGFLEEAIVSYQIATQLQPDFPDAHNNLGVALVLQGRHREGVAALERAFALYMEAGGTDPAIPDVLYNLATAQFRVGDFRRAMPLFRRAVALRPEFLPARWYIGKTALASGDTAGARVAWQEAARMGSSEAEDELRQLKEK
jgi:Flp pilus assembly protein TadD